MYVSGSDLTCTCCTNPSPAPACTDMEPSCIRLLVLSHHRDEDTLPTWCASESAAIWHLVYAHPGQTNPLSAGLDTA